MMSGGGESASAIDLDADHGDVAAGVGALDLGGDHDGIQARSTLVTQIMPGDGARISTVNIVGRPKSPYTGTMGDHSTAFSVQVEAVKRGLEGKTYEEARRAMEALQKATERLPGAALAGKLKPEQLSELSGLSEYSGLKAEMDTRLKALEPYMDYHQGMLRLQEYVNSFLSFREHLPLSTVNVFVLSPARAGKGHGEAGAKDTLARFERGEPVSSPGVLHDAIVGMFDTQAVALQAAQTDQVMATDMAPGLDVTQGTKERVKPYVKQHMQSIELAFPKAYKKATQGRDMESALLRSTLVSTLAEIKVNLELQRRHIAAANARIERQTAYDLRKELGLKRKVDGMDLDTFRKEVDRVDLLSKDAIHQLMALAEGKINNGKIYDTLRMDLALLQAHKREKEKLEAKEKEVTEYFVEVFGHGPTVHDVVMGDDATNVDTTGAVDEEKLAAEKEKKAPLATQVVLNKKGEVEAFWSAGRPPSPFPNTMGAHTTAWVVHVDVMRTAVQGKTVGEAVESLHKVKEHALRTAASRKEKFASLDLDDDDFAISNDHKARLWQQEVSVNAFEEKIEADEQKSPFLMQQYINEILTLANYTPGATLESANPDNKGEQDHRKVLLNYAPESSERLEQAIEGLLDSGAAPDWLKGTLRDTHKQLIEMAYPNAYAKAYGRPSEPKAAASSEMGTGPAPSGSVNNPPSNKQPPNNPRLRDRIHSLTSDDGRSKKRGGARGNRAR